MRPRADLSATTIIDPGWLMKVAFTRRRLLRGESKKLEMRCDDTGKTYCSLSASVVRLALRTAIPLRHIYPGKLLCGCGPA